jgi:hypothetical protein
MIMVLLDNVQIVASTTGSFLYVCMPFKMLKIQKHPTPHPLKNYTNQFVFDKYTTTKLLSYGLLHIVPIY